MQCVLFVWLQVPAPSLGVQTTKPPRSSPQPSLSWGVVVLRSRGSNQHYSLDPGFLSAHRPSFAQGSRHDFDGRSRQSFSSQQSLAPASLRKSWVLAPLLPPRAGRSWTQGSLRKALSPHQGRQERLPPRSSHVSPTPLVRTHFATFSQPRGGGRGHPPPIFFA